MVATPSSHAFLVLVVSLSLGPACDRKTMTISDVGLEEIPRGMWGGQHISLEVTGEGARIEYDCAHGAISQQIRADRSGRFEAKGVHVREHGGPVREGEDAPSRPARYSGRTDGKTMTLTVTLTDPDENVGTFTLEYRKEARLTKCQ
jgi:hypothetical protein